MVLLKAGSGESLNVKGAYLEVWSDMLGSVGVIIGAVVIKVTGWTVTDPIIAVLISLWVLPRALKLLREAGHILMEGVPTGVDLDDVRARMLTQAGIASVHDLHAWSLGSRERALTAHVVISEGTDATAVRVALATMLSREFDIFHATLQVEVATDCRDGADPITRAHV